MDAMKMGMNQLKAPQDIKPYFRYWGKVSKEDSRLFKTVLCVIGITWLFGDDE